MRWGGPALRPSRAKLTRLELARQELCGPLPRKRRRSLAVACEGFIEKGVWSAFVNVGAEALTVRGHIFLQLRHAGRNELVVGTVMALDRAPDLRQLVSGWVPAVVDDARLEIRAASG